MDAVKNFAKIVVSAGYDSSAVSITLQDGDGAKLPTPATDGEFNLVWWNFTDYPDPTDDAGVEIVRCIAKAGDVITVVRAQEETHASDKNLFNKKYKMILALTKKMMDDIALELIGRLTNIVEDLSPQLGGNLDLQNHTIVGEGGTAGVYVNSAGNVGIGTTSPDAKLELLMDNPQLLFTDSNEAVDKKSFRIINVTQQMRLTARTDENLGNADGADIMVWERDGNVGIGTNTPTTTLDLVGTFMSSDLQLGGREGSVWPTMCRASDGGLSIDLSSTAYGRIVSFSVNGAEKMRVRTNGNVGIGTNAPTATLDINSDAIRLRTAKTPATAGAPGNTGDIAWDADYIYICISTNSWHRAAHAAW